MAVVRSVSEILGEGLWATLQTWRERLSGEGDLLYWTLVLKLAQAQNPTEDASPQVPATFQGSAWRTHAAINQYFDNVRYALLDPLTQVWGTVVNALRVAAAAESVTPAQ